MTRIFFYRIGESIVVVIVTNPMLVLPWVHEKFTVKFIMSKVDGCIII